MKRPRTRSNILSELFDINTPESRTFVVPAQPSWQMNHIVFFNKDIDIRLSIL